MFERIPVHARLLSENVEGMLFTLTLGVCREIGAFGEDYEPHGTLLLFDFTWTSVPQLRWPIFLESFQAVVNARFVYAEFARHEDEAVEHHSWAYDRNLPQRILEHDVDCAMHFAGVGDPPQVEPLGVDLVVGYQDESFR